MTEKEMAEWQTLVEEMTHFLIVDPGKGDPFLTLSKAKNCLRLVLMILRVRLDTLLVMVGMKNEKKRNLKRSRKGEVRKEKKASIVE